MTDILIIGAGLIGSALAYHLASAGADVTIVDGGRPGGGTSSATFAWLNANQKTPHEYFDLNVAGMREHRALKEAVGFAPWLHDGGNLEWAGERQDQSALAAKIQRLRAWGYAAEWLSPKQVSLDLEPDLHLDPARVEQVAYFPEECWLDPLLLIHFLLESAEHHGARLLAGHVTEIAVASGRVQGAGTGGGDRLWADIVVDCAGRAASSVAALMGFSLPMANTAGLLAVTAPAPTCLGRVVHAPGVNLRPDGAGRLLLHSDEMDGVVDASTTPDPGLAPAQELLHQARQVLPALAGVPLEAVRIGVRPIPGDGHSAVGPIPGVEGAYLAVTHSGATLCLALGRMLGTELLTGRPAPELATFRPARFLSPASV